MTLWKSEHTSLHLFLYLNQVVHQKLISLYILVNISNNISFIDLCGEALDSFLLGLQWSAQGATGGSVSCSRTLRHATMGRAGNEPGTVRLRDNHSPHWATADLIRPTKRIQKWWAGWERSENWPGGRWRWVACCSGSWRASSGRPCWKEHLSDGPGTCTTVRTKQEG